MGINKLVITIFFTIVSTFSIFAQTQKVGNIVVDETAEIDFVSDSIRRQATINDYSMLGVHYGAALSNVMWNPKMEQKYLFSPINVGISYTKYGKMFGFMPYFGFEASLLYTKEGYQFEANKESGKIPTLNGATKAVIEVLELPILAQIHVDFWKMKIIANIGCYAGYRFGIERYGEFVKDEIRNSFLDTDIKFDYGLKGGVGFGLIFDPIEIHIKGLYKYSFSSLMQPDAASEYFYRFAYPNNIILQVGVHIQLDKRIGKSRSSIRRQAKKDLGLIKEEPVIVKKKK